MHFARLLAWLPVVAGLRAGRRRAAVPAPTAAAALKILRCAEPSSVVLIDGDNCRGKARWQLSAAALASRAAATAASGAFGEAENAVVFLDHGEARDCRVVDGVGVAFAGRAATADDAIVDALEWWLDRGAHALVVTSDYGLRERCAFLAARCERGGGDARGVRFASSETLIAVLDAAPPPPARAYDADFAAALDRLAAHVLTAPASVRARARHRGPVAGSPLGNEQTWMRVVLAERLRRLLEAAPEPPPRAEDDDALAAFAGAFAAPPPAAGAASAVLQHPLSDRKHRHELLRFADALRRPAAADDADDAPPDSEESDAPAVPAPPQTSNPLGNRRLRRNRRHRHKRLRGVVAAGGAPGAKVRALLADRDALEAALYAWLRGDDPIDVGEITVPQ